MIDAKEKEKAARAERWRQWAARQTPAQVSARRERSRAWWTPERRQAASEKRRLWFANLTPEQRAAFHRLQKPRRDKDAKRKRANHSGIRRLLNAAQGSRCAVCGMPEAEQENRYWKRLGIDHDHKTGKVRGLLCISCNAIEGHLQKLQLHPLRFAEQLLSYLNHPPAVRIGLHADYPSL